MNHRLQNLVESHPHLSFAVAFFNWLLAGFEWTAHHADDFGKIVAAVAAFVGLGAAWYAFRINRRAWQRGATKPPFEPENLK